MERRINPAEAGMVVTAKSTGAFKIIEDNRGMETQAIPLEDSEPLGSDAEYIREIEKEKATEVEKKRLEDVELYALEHPNAPKIKSVMKNRTSTKTFAPVNEEDEAQKELEATEEKIRIVQEELKGNISINEVEIIPEIKDVKPKINTDDIEAQYEIDMANLNERIAKLKKIEEDNKNSKSKAIQVSKSETPIIKQPVSIPVAAVDSNKILKLEEANRSLTDALISYKNKTTISELKTHYKIQLLIKEIVSVTDEETSGKILSRFYKYINENEGTDSMLSIR